MKAEIIKGLYVLLTIDDDKTYKSTFCPFRDRPFEFDSPFYADDRFENVSLLENGNVSFVFKYCKEKDFKKEKFILEKNQPLVIIDTYNSWDRDLEKDIVHNYKFELHLEYKEVEVDDNNLVLLIKESAGDSSGDYYNSGEQKSYLPVKEGEVISSCLSKKEQFYLEIEKVDGLNITLKCLSFARRPKYPYTEIHRVTVNPYYFAYFNVQGGSHSRYDSGSCDWNFTLELDIKDAVKFMYLGD